MVGCSKDNSSGKRATAPAAKRRRRYSRRLQNLSPLPVEAPPQEPAVYHATGATKAPPPTFETLPADIVEIVVSHLDDASVCRLYAAFNERMQMYVPVKKAIARRLEKFTVLVSPELHLTLIDLDTAALLPPWCHVHVKSRVAYWDLAKWYLRQLKFALVVITVYGSSLYDQYCVDFNGVKGNVVAVHFVNIYNIDFSGIPRSTKELSFPRVILWNEVDLTHLTKLTRVDILPPGCPVGTEGPKIILPQLVTTIHNLLYDIVRFSPLSHLQHFSYGWLANLPWSQLKTAAVEFIKDGTRCDLLEEVKIKAPADFRNIRCPNLRSVMWNSLSYRHISEIFTNYQMNRLRTFKGEMAILDDLTELLQVEVLHVRYNHTFTKHTPLPPSLVELKIYSKSPVEGIPDQLKVFEYKRTYYLIGENAHISVTSATLKRLLIVSARSLSFNCPHLEELMIHFARSIGERIAPKLRKLNLKGLPIPLENFPNLRQLHMLNFSIIGPSKVDVVIGQYLESVTIEHVELDRVVFSANEVTLKHCSFWTTPAISARVLKALETTIKGGITCQELICDTIERVPNMVEYASLQSLPLHTRRLFSGCNKLASVSIDSGRCVNDELVIPASVVQLKLPREAKFRFEGTEMSKTPQKLKYFHWEGTRTENQIDHTPEGIKNRFEQIESNWCHRDKLRLRQPLNI